MGAISALLVSPLAAEFPTISLSPISDFRTGVFDESSAEIVVFDKDSNKLFIVNGDSEAIDVLDITDPKNPNRLASIDVSGAGGPSSVAVSRGVVAVAVQGTTSRDRGKVKFFDTEGIFLGETRVGYHPDMVTFTPDGRTLLVANEGELEDLEDPTSYDPVGSVTVIKVFRRKGGLKTFSKQLKFKNLCGRLRKNVRVGITPDSTVEQDLEPEYIAVSADSSTAWVSLQENNGIAIIDLKEPRITRVVSLGFKNHSQVGNGLDASNKDDAINIKQWPVLGMYQPDTIATYEAEGKTYIVTANEGDSRDFEEARVKDLVLDPKAFPNAVELQKEEKLGRLKVTTTLGDLDKDGDYDRLYSFGGRSFSILNENGKVVFDSGDEFEQVVAAKFPEDFNSTNDENGSFDNRSDDKGPEPEALTIGKVNGRTYAFIGLERVGGIMIYDITSPTAPTFIDYVSQRNFAGVAEDDTAGDLGPEGMAFIPAEESPSGKALLAVSYEVSGSTVIFEVVPGTGEE